MAKFSFPHKESGKNIVVDYDGVKMFSSGPIKCYADDQLMGEINNMEAFKVGKIFDVDGVGEVRVFYRKVFLFIWAIAVEVGGTRVSGSQVLE
jgi:hypothetical protein